MEEVEINSEEGQVAPAETTVQDVSSQTNQKPDLELQYQQRNWREIRRQKDELEQKLRMQEEMNQKLMQLVTKPNQVQEIEEQEEPDDDIINKGKVKRLAKKEVEPLQKRIDELERTIEIQKQSNLLNNLKRQFSDFDDVVNPETLSLLEEQDPDLAATIADLRDPYKIGLQSYKYIKAMNLADKVPQVRRAREVDQKIEKNNKTVQTPQAFDKRPMAQAFRLTEADKSKLYEEMTSCARFASSVPELSS